jgi:hypothetical protein
VLPGCRRAYEHDLPAGTRLKVLEPWEFVVLRAAAARILDGAGEGPSATDIVQRADAEIAGLEDPAVRAGVGQVLLVVEYATPLWGHVRPFSALPAAAQDRVLGGLATSRLRSARVAFATVKLLAYYFHYTDPVTWKPLGYDGPWVGRVPLPAYAVDYGVRNDAPFVSGSRGFPPEKT